MILQLNNTPTTLVAFVAFETVTHDDFDKVVIPAAHELVQRTGKLNYLLVVADTTKRRSLNTSMHAAMPALTRWNRAGIVTDTTSMQWVTELFQKNVPAKLKVFEHGQIEHAIKWVAEQS